MVLFLGKKRIKKTIKNQSLFLRIVTIGEGRGSLTNGRLVGWWNIRGEQKIFNLFIKTENVLILFFYSPLGETHP